MPRQIIGISGTNGSGKDTVGHLLVQEHNFLFVSGSDMLRAELKAQGLPLTREQTRSFSSAWRRKSGLGVIIDKAVEVYEQAGGDSKYSGLAIASLRNPGEADSVHERGGKVIWVDAEPKIRYDRIRANAHLRGADRAASDDLSFTKFLSEEAAEMNPATQDDPTLLSMSGVKAKSDLFLQNNGQDLGLLSNELNRLLGFSQS